MDYNFTRAVDYAGKYDREEMLEYLMEKISGAGVLGAMKAKVFIENMEKYSLEELQKRLK
jgi:hypothetical protein